ncbi:MAG: opacity protein-like surface antigen, partial [Woeseiaceae bacterium]
MKKAVLTILLLSVSVTANAQRDKSQTWEWSFAALYQESERMGSTNGSSLKIDSEVGFGFNIGYNLTDHFAIGVDLDFLRPDY